MKIRRINRLIAKKIDGEFIIFDTENGLVYELNPTAETIWKLLSKEKTIEKLINEIVMKFDITHITAKKDILFFINKYQGKLFNLKK